MKSLLVLAAVAAVTVGATAQAELLSVEDRAQVRQMYHTYFDMNEAQRNSWCMNSPVECSYVKEHRAHLRHHLNEKFQNMSQAEQTALKNRTIQSFNKAPKQAQIALKARHPGVYDWISEAK